MNASTTAATAPPVAGVLELHDAQLTQQLDAYYDRTKLLAVVQGFVCELTQRFATTRLVPMDIYAPLLSHVRLAEISATELLVNPRPRDLKALAGTVSHQELLLFDPRDGRNVAVERQIATFKAQPPPALAVWGTRRVLESIPYSLEWQRGVEELYELAALWLGESETTDEACVVRCAGAFVGFEGFLMRRSTAHVTMVIERHVVVVGEQLELAMTAFARQLIRSLFEATKKNAVITLPSTDSELTLVSVGAIQISNPNDSKRSDVDDQGVWTLERVTANRQAFVAAVKLALVANAVFVLDLLYEECPGSQGDDRDHEPNSRVVRCQVGFFFHFDGDSQAPAQRQPGASPTKTKAATNASSASKSRSFVSRSRLRDSGLFVSTRSACELTRRFHDQQERDADAGFPQVVETIDKKPQPPSPLDGLIETMIRSTRSSVETRHWLSLLSGSLACRLLAQLLALIDTMLYVIRSVAAEDESSISSIVWRLLRSSRGLYEEAITELVEDASVGQSSSLLRGVGGVIRELCSLTQHDPPGENLDAFYLRLQCSRDAINWIFSGASRDFGLLVKLTTSDQSLLSATPNADLRADIALAIEERCYPPAIVSETVFAQYLVNARLDVALERSLVNTVVCGLPPNPFVPFSSHLRAFAAESQLERSEERHTAASSAEIKSVDGVGFVLQVPGPLKQLVSPNKRLLQHLNVARVRGLHGFLTRQQVYRSAPYNPSTASYSARIFTSLIVDDPLLTIPEPLDEVLTQRLEIVEHIVIEGTDDAQALWFFADAVRRDVQRLLVSQSSGFTQLTLLDPHGKVLTTVELRDISKFEQLLTEATPRQCTLQISLPPAIDNHPSGQLLEPLLRLVRKSYLFHHTSSAQTTSHTSSVSPRTAFRLRTFAVFMDIESARVASTQTSPLDLVGCEISHQTSYSSRAVEQNDALVLRYLAWISSSSTAPSTAPDPPPALLLRLLDVETALRWLLDRVLDTQPTDGSTPRSTADAAASLVAAMLPRIVQSVQRRVLPVVESVGFVDANCVREILANVGTLLTHRSTGDTDTWVQATQDCVQRLWVLLVLVRVALDVDLERYHYK